MSRGRPPAWPSLALLAATAAGASLAVHDGLALLHRAVLPLPVVAPVVALVVLGQSVGLYYLLGMLAKAASFAPLARRATPPSAGGATPPVAVLYLTAGDYDAAAVDSLLRLESDGPLLFVLHDDGNDETARRRMREALEAHPCRGRWQVEVWHRPDRAGGKAGAVNWVLERLEPRWSLLLLCDSDSIALDPGALVRVAGEFADPGVAVVQCRNAGVDEPGEGAMQRRLARAIDVFDVFATPQAAWGYLPFFGHNALVRLADLRAQGGLTPGFFSDDLDFSVRLALAGRRVVYRRDVAFGERHPADWSSFRKRARKWAFGCMQVVRARAARVLVTPGLPFAHRVGLLEFMGFYPAQGLLLASLLAGHLLLPWMVVMPSPSPAFVAGGALALLALVAPTLAWAASERRLREWPALAWTLALVYGGSILPTVRGVLDGLSRRDRPWVPTNLAARRPAVPPVAWAEAALGLALAIVPWSFGGPALAFPATYLFIATFLYAPLTWEAYRERPPATAAVPARRLAAGAAALLVLAALLPPSRALAAAPGEVRAAGGRLVVDGRPFEVRGVHYSPWLPGTGPGHGPYPGAATVDADLRAIRGLGANTLLVDGAPRWVLDRAHALGLHFVVAFDIAWSDTSRAAFERQADAIVAGVDSLRGAPGVLLLLLGHEVPPWVVDELGAHEVESRLAALAARVRQHDPTRLLGHGNWPPTRNLDLSFLDVECFNLYPAWPYEVAVRGYGPFLREVLMPLAHGRPLLVTEFGLNSLEASEARQARVLTDCWREIHGSGTAGGIVFEWCDEWWKNWDNPIPGKGYWERRYDPTDAARHDDDPEEYYGIVAADRRPKPAFAAVKAMWSGGERMRAVVPAGVLLLLGLATWAGFGLERRRARARAAAAAAPVAGTAALLLALAGLGLASRANATTMLADTLWDVQQNAQFGWTVADVHGVAGDGRGTAAVGAHFWTGAQSAEGAVFLWPAGSPPGAPPSVSLYGISANEHFGESIAAGDVDGDGVPDLAVGARLRSTNGFSANGAVDVFHGGALGAGTWRTYDGEASDDWFGQSVAVGDLDGDGLAELIVGAPYNDRGGSAAGAVFIYRGSDPPGSPPWRVLVGEAANDQFGWSVAYVGDATGDGYGDVVVGARLHSPPGKSSAGRAYLFAGGPSMSTTAAGTWDGEVRDDWFGNAVSGVGDVDGGGRADILVGAPYNDRGGSAAGAAYLFRGEDPPGSPPVAIYVGESANAQLGWTVSGAGDVNGDGRPDVIAGARMQASGALVAAGRAYLYAGGATPSTTAFATFDGRTANAWLGNCVSPCRGYFGPATSAGFAGAPYDDTTTLTDVGSATVAMPAASAGVPAPEVLPAARLAAWPNPAPGAIWLRSAEGGVLVVRDVTGRRVRTLTAAAGAQALWDGRDDAGRAQPPGVYLVTGPAALQRETVRVMLLR